MKFIERPRSLLYADALSLAIYGNWQGSSVCQFVRLNVIPCDSSKTTRSVITKSLGEGGY